MEDEHPVHKHLNNVGTHAIVDKYNTSLRAEIMNTLASFKTMLSASESRKQTPSPIL